MTNWNYTMEKRNENFVLVNQNTKNKDYEVKEEDVDHDNKLLEARGLVSSVKNVKFPFDRIDNIKEIFPEDYI